MRRTLLKNKKEAAELIFKYERADNVVMKMQNKRECSQHKCATEVAHKYRHFQHASLSDAIAQYRPQHLTDDLNVSVINMTGETISTLKNECSITSAGETSHPSIEGFFIY